VQPRRASIPRFSGRLKFAISLLPLFVCSIILAEIAFGRTRSILPDHVTLNFLSPSIRYSDLATMTTTTTTLDGPSLAPPFVSPVCINVAHKGCRQRQTKPSLFRESGQADAILLYRARARAREHLSMAARLNKRVTLSRARHHPTLSRGLQLQRLT